MLIAYFSDAVQFFCALKNAPLRNANDRWFLWCTPFSVYFILTRAITPTLKWFNAFVNIETTWLSFQCVNFTEGRKVCSVARMILQILRLKNAWNKKSISALNFGSFQRLRTLLWEYCFKVAICSKSFGMVIAILPKQWWKWHNAPVVVQKFMYWTLLRSQGIIWYTFPIITWEHNFKLAKNICTLMRIAPNSTPYKCSKTVFNMLE